MSNYRGTNVVNWVVCAAGLTGTITVVLMAIAAAENLERSPTSVDPILRHLPLEKERVRPESKPGLKIPPVRGKQTVLLRPPYEKPDGPRSPLIVLRIPAEFLANPTTKPTEVFGLNLHLKYPSMTRLVEFPDSCRGWCEGKMTVTLESRRVDTAARAALRVKNIRENMVRQSALADPLISYNALTPPPDYNEAYDVAYNRWSHEGRYRQFFWTNEKDGSISEFVECHPKVTSPNCEFLISLPDQPRLQISYVHSMDYWPNRRDVQKAVVALVRQFYEREIPR